VALAVRRVVAKLGKVDPALIRATFPSLATTRRTKLGKVDPALIRAADRWPDDLGILPFWDSIDFLHFVLSMELELKCKIVGGASDLLPKDEPITVAYLASRVFEMRR